MQRRTILQILLIQNLLLTKRRRKRRRKPKKTTSKIHTLLLKTPLLPYGERGFLHIKKTKKSADILVTVRRIAKTIKSINADEVTIALPMRHASGLYCIKGAVVFIRPSLK